MAKPAIGNDVNDPLWSDEATDQNRSRKAAQRRGAANEKHPMAKPAIGNDVNDPLWSDEATD